MRPAVGGNRTGVWAAAKGASHETTDAPLFGPRLHARFDRYPCLRYDRLLSAADALYITGFAGLDQPAGKEFFAGGQAGYSRALANSGMNHLVAEVGYDYSYVSYFTPIDSYAQLHSIRAFLGYDLT